MYTTLAPLALIAILIGTPYAQAYNNIIILHICLDRHLQYRSVIMGSFLDTSAIHTPINVTHVLLIVIGWAPFRGCSPNVYADPLTLNVVIHLWLAEQRTVLLTQLSYTWATYIVLRTCSEQ
jgi:hypothetical protein